MVGLRRTVDSEGTEAWTEEEETVLDEDQGTSYSLNLEIQVERLAIMLYYVYSKF